jgi:hypothetical protein
MTNQKKDMAIFETKNMVLVTQEFLVEMFDRQAKFLDLLSKLNYKDDIIGDYISEKEAKKILGRKTTWFWNLRKNGKLPYSKVGNKVFYSKATILKFIEGNKISQ